MASVILCGTPAVVCNEIDGGVRSISLPSVAPPQTLTGDISLTTTGDALLTLSAPNTININVPTPAVPITYIPTFVDVGAPVGLPTIVDGGTIDYPLDWAGTLDFLLSGPALPQFSGISLGLGGFSFVLPALACTGPIGIQITDGGANVYPALPQPTLQVQNFGIAGSVSLPSILIDAPGLQAEGAWVVATPHLRITNNTGQTITLVGVPPELPTSYVPVVSQ